jgi:hypothetical protein
LEDFPRTYEIASPMLVFPLPFGPVMTENPGGNGMDALRLKDLNPCRTSLCSRAISIALLVYYVGHPYLFVQNPSPTKFKHVKTISKKEAGST